MRKKQKREQRMSSLPTDYQQFIATSRYARWLPEEKRRETWDETVLRYINYLYYQAKHNTSISKADLKLLHQTLGATCDA